MREKKTVLIVFTIIISYLAQGCYSYEYVETSREYFPDQSKIIKYEYDLRKYKEPNLIKPTFEIELIKYPLFQKSEKITYKTIKHFSSSNTSWLIAVIGAGLMAIGALVYISDESNQSTGLAIAGPGEVILILVAPFYAMSKGDSRTDLGVTKDSVNEVYGTIKSTIFQKEFSPNIKLIAKLDSQEKEFFSHLGMYSINMVDDFNLVRFEKIKDLEIKTTINELNVSRSFFLSPRLWTTEFIKIKIDESEMFDENVNVLGKLKLGDEYQILHLGSELDKIKYGNKTGFINKNVGQYFWAVPNN